MVSFTLSDLMLAADVRPQRAERVLRPVHANAGLEAIYRRRLSKLIEEMNDSIIYWLKAAYRAAPPEIAQDELSSAAMRAAIQRLTRRWIGRFDKMAEQLAEYFATAVSARSDAALKQILKDGGISIEWRMTRAQRDVLQAAIHENVSLIKSIPREHLSRVEGLVMRSVQTGRDLEQLTKDLRKQFGVTRRRAVLIARDQNSKMTSALTRARYIEIGVTDAIWVHSGGGNHPRPSHVKAGRDRIRYNVKDGWFDPDVGKKIHPGELINCRCISRPVLRRIK